MISKANITQLENNLWIIFARVLINIILTVCINFWQSKFHPLPHHYDYCNLRHFVQRLFNWLALSWFQVYSLNFWISVVWSYFTIVLHSYYKTLLLGGAGNFVNINGVEYFAPTERIAGKSVPQDVPPQLNVPPSYYTASAYPIQPTISYPQAPPSYDEAAGPNASMYPSFPPTRQWNWVQMGGYRSRT